jgi:hypothetical protein
MAVFQLGLQRHFIAPSAAKCSPPFFWLALGLKDPVRATAPHPQLPGVNYVAPAYLIVGEHPQPLWAVQRNAWPRALHRAASAQSQVGASGHTRGHGQEPSAFRSVIRHLRGEVKKPC